MTRTSLLCVFCRNPIPGRFWDPEIDDYSDDIVCQTCLPLQERPPRIGEAPPIVAPHINEEAAQQRGCLNCGSQEIGIREYLTRWKQCDWDSDEYNLLRVPLEFDEEEITDDIIFCINCNSENISYRESTYN